MFDHSHFESKAQLLELLDQELAVNEVERWSPVASRFLPRFACKATRRDDETFVCSTNHCTSEVSNDVWADTAAMSLALEEHVKTDEPTNPDDSKSVNAAISGSSSDLNLEKPSFAKQPLAKSLESSGGHFK